MIVITRGEKKPGGWLGLDDLQFCEGVVKAINRDPNRRARVERNGVLCRVVDYAVPVVVGGYGHNIDHGKIIGWKLPDNLTGEE